MVNRSRRQSSEAPSARCCCAMRFPYSSFHFHTRRTNSSRPRSWRDFFSVFCSSRSTTICVAMPAWSMPGIHSALKPLMRFQRMSASSRVAVRAWPRCRLPVTLGGGRMMQYGGLSDSSSAWK